MNAENHKHTEPGQLLDAQIFTMLSSATDLFSYNIPFKETKPYSTVQTFRIMTAGLDKMELEPSMKACFCLKFSACVKAAACLHIFD